MGRKTNKTKKPPIQQTTYATFIKGQSKKHISGQNTETHDFKYFTDTMQRFFKYSKSSAELQFPSLIFLGM